MQKIKTKKKIALSLLLASAVAVGGAAIALGASQTAYAEDYTQELDGTKVFYTGIRGAEITYSTEEVGEDTKAYAMFKIGKDETVEYRQNLAYSWYSNAVNGKFSMEIGFDNAAFERFVIKFQSQQYVLTEDKITENYIVFTPSQTEGKVDMSVVQKLEDDTTLTPVASYALNSHIKIAFGDFNDGEYPLIVNGDTVASFKNVYEPFATYISSGDKAVTPLTFSATFAEGQQDNTADMVLYNINGQSFEFKSSKEVEGNVVYETKITDNTAPVMCFTKTPSYLIDGDDIGFDYKVIDVIGTSTRATAYYYVLSGDQYQADNFDYDKYNYSGESDNASDNPFIEVTSSSSIRIIRDENTFIPSSLYNENVYGLVKIYYKISDRLGNSAQSDYIFADWYAKDEALVDIADLKGSGTSSKFLKLIDEEEHKPGLTYAQESDLTATDTTAEETDPVLYSYKQTIVKFQKAYQKKINAAIAALEDGKLYAGTDSKFYLPSFDNLIDENGNPLTFDLADTDDYYTKSDYKYSIYYKAKTSGSSTSLASNALAISLGEADVNYRFTIFITDSFGNDMRYPTLGDNGEIVWESITTDDVWNEDFADLLPFFEFHVSYKEATATPPESLSIAYVNSSYSGVSFSIKGVSGTYTAKYSLYVVDRDKLNDELGETLTYERFKEKVDELFDDAKYRKYFTTVKPANSLLETDENYELFKELNWNATSISFTPRSVNDFYVVRLTLEDNNSKQTDYQYAVVSASVETTSLKGESDWVEKNLAAVILFSVAGAFAVVFVILLIIKPKDSDDIDQVYTEEVEKEKGKKSKKGKKTN